MQELKRILVIGCGGIGGVVSARLTQAGYDVTAVTANDAIAEAIEANGLVANFDDTIHTVRFDAHAALAPGALAEPFELAVLAVPPTAVEEAVHNAVPLLRDDAQILCLPNGLVEERVSKLVDPGRVLGGVVEFGARMLGPGRVMQTAPGGVTMGRLPRAERRDDPEMAAVARVMEDVGPVHFADNLEGARWSKLAINCAISSLGTIGGDRLGALLRYRFVRRLALETMTEVVDVARALDVNIEKVAGTLDLEWLALDPEERLKLGSASLLAKHGVLLAVGMKFRKMRSSMLAAIERGREPAVDFLNGEVVDRGPDLDIPTPINRALQEKVNAIAAGEDESSHDTLRELYEQTRPTLRELELAS